MEFKAYAIVEKGGKLTSWKYTPRPLGDHDIEIKISHCGICHSDIHIMDNGWGGTVYPVVPGHEIVGTVVAFGKDVKEFKAGERVGVGAQCLSCLGSNSKCISCPKGEDNYCTDVIWTYNSQFNDGAMSYGGYAEAVRVHSRFVFKVPDALASEVAAPLFCAGATVYAPLTEANIKEGVKVAVTGLGGLGHLAVQIAAKMGGSVTVISSSPSKKEDALKLGAEHFVDISDKKQANAAISAFDVVIVTAVYNGMKWAPILNYAKPRGKVILVALPEEDVAFNAFNLTMKGLHFIGSAVANPKQINEMLEFCAKHKIAPWIQKMPMSKANEAVQIVRENKIRYRMVLEN